MAQFSLHAYDADVWVPEFRGIKQDDDGMNSDLRFADEEENLETINGTLQPLAAIEYFPEVFPEARIETLAWFYRRWYDSAGSKGWLVAAAGGKLYYKQTGNRTPWQEIPFPDGVTEYQSNVWSWITYEVNPQGSDYPVDVLILSNPVDGMVMIVPPKEVNTWGDAKLTTWGDPNETGKTWRDRLSTDWEGQAITVPDDVKFGVIERYGERIWGGAIPGEPDQLIYSAPYDPLDWEANAEIPEDGAGVISQPSWDGRSFTALKAFGDQLLAFKENKVWRVLGIEPGSFEMKEQFGGGAPYPNTVAVDVEKVFLTDDNGPAVYDGMSVNPYAREQIRRVWQSVNKGALDQMCAILHDHRYYLAIPTNGSEVNNAMLVYNQDEGTILYYNQIFIEAFLSTPEGLFATTSTTPGKVMQIHRDSWVTGAAEGLPTKWVSPWIDFGRKNIQKGGFELYFAPEVKDEAVTFNFTIQTEKKSKMKTYTAEPLDSSAKEVGKQHRFKRLHFGGAGRRFRVIIETESGVTAPWRLIGGLHLVVETDPD